MFFKKFKIKKVKDPRGIIEIFENDEKFNFKIKRVFYIHSNYRGYPRGNHAHRLTNQILICINGSAKLILNNGKVKKSFNLKKGGFAIYVKTGVWHTIKDMSKDCLLLVFCDKKYLNRRDYVNDYDKFLKLYG